MKLLSKCGRTATLIRGSTTTAWQTWSPTSGHGKSAQAASWSTEETEQGLPADLLRRRLKASVGHAKHRNHQGSHGWTMPTLLQTDGFKFFFYANEHEPKHVHVSKGDDYAKIELNSFAVKTNQMKPKDPKEALVIVQLHNREFEEFWYDWQRKRQSGSF